MNALSQAYKTIGDIHRHLRSRVILTMFDARSIKDDGQKNSAQGDFFEKNRGFRYSEY
jgi:hypothetical protein